jgi:hypothetical protein
VRDLVAEDRVVAGLVRASVQVEQAEAVVVRTVADDLAVRGVAEEAEQVARNLVPGQEDIRVR